MVCSCMTNNMCSNLCTPLIATKFIAVLVPSCPGAPFDLANSQYLAKILDNFVTEKSKALMLKISHNISYYVSEQ